MPLSFIFSINLFTRVNAGRGENLFSSRGKGLFDGVRVKEDGTGGLFQVNAGDQAGRPRRRQETLQTGG
jgi:hypothetical protein